MSEDRGEKGATEGKDTRKRDEVKNEDEHINYYNEFCRLYLTNTILSSQLNELMTEKSELITKLSRVEVSETI